MTILQALILGLVQGLTELLPISSSAHLILLPSFFNWGISPLVFDTTLHLGTALALIVYFRRELCGILKNFFSDFFKNGFRFGNFSPEGLLAVGIVAGSVPAALLGIFAEDAIEGSFRSVSSVLVFLGFGTVLMLLAEVFSHPKLFRIEEIKVSKSFFIGLFQSLALFSGISRSGATISGGMLFGVKREIAAKYSFLLSIPIVLGAGIYELMGGFEGLTDIAFPVILSGFAASFLSAIFAIKFLMSYLKNHTLKGFIIYRILLIIGISLML